MGCFSIVICLSVLAFVIGGSATDTRISHFGNFGGGFHIGGGGYPGNQYPGQGYPGQGLPGQGFPGQGFPGQGFPGQGFPGGSSTCRYWCKTPSGQYYCCDRGNNEGSPFPSVRPGFCPPVRPQCPPTRFFGRPVPCAHDNNCNNYSDKCCFDTCLQEHVCKPAQNYGK